MTDTIKNFSNEKLISISRMFDGWQPAASHSAADAEFFVAVKAEMVRRGIT